MPPATPFLTLNNGVEIPAVGLGVFQTPPEETRDAVRAALDAGYRHIDTAAAYGNERQVGEAVRRCGRDRSEVFLETKIWISDYGYDETLHGYEKSARKFGVDQIDLLILHQALPSAFDRTLEAYRALESLLADGKVRAIGVSNFMVDHLTTLLEHAAVVPAVNQIECHPYFQQRDVQDFDTENGILTQAWSPIGGITFYREGDHSSTLDDPTIGDIASAHGKTAAQVMLRWGLQHGRSVIPKSTKPTRIAENIDVFDFELTEGEWRRSTGWTPAAAAAPSPTQSPWRRSAARSRRPSTMEYRPLGCTGVQVSKLCLGTMMFGAWGNSDHDDSIRIIHAALDAGINFVDTADVYSAGESESILGKALKGRRDNIVLATKFFMPMGEDPNQRGGSRRWIITEVENSLKRLGTDWIDLYQVHRPDSETDVEETLSALTDLVRQGKVRYVGSSSYSAGEIVEAQWTACARNLQRFRTEQPPYSLLVRGIELDVLPTARRHGMGILTYSPLAGGWLSGRWSAEATPTSPARQRLVTRFDMTLPENQRKLEATEALGALADEAGLSLIDLAIAFVVNHPAVTSAIIGPRTMEQLDSQLPAADVTLDATLLDGVDEIVRPGVNINPADTSYGEQLLQTRLRRR